MSNDMKIKQWHTFIDSYLNGGLVNPLLKLGNGWVTLAAWKSGIIISPCTNLSVTLDVKGTPDGHAEAI